MFADRREAGQLLAAKILGLELHRPVVLALPRGGVPVGFEIAMTLDAPLYAMVVRKLGVPSQPEFAFGAIAPDGVRVLDQTTIDLLHLSPDQIDRVEQLERAELGRRQLAYAAGLAPPELRDHTAILVDDGLATGLSMKAAVTFAARRDPARIVVAVPVCAPDAVRSLYALLRPGNDEILCLQQPFDFAAVSSYYGDFTQITDDEIRFLFCQAERHSHP